MRPLRLWPGIALAVLELALFFGLRFVMPDDKVLGFFGAVICGALGLVWWLFFSRAPWLERLGIAGLMVAAVLALKFVVDPSISGAGMGMMLYILPVPVLALALVAGLLISRRASTASRPAVVAVAILIGCGTFALIRTSGVRGTGTFEYHWRWTPTAEDRLLAQAAHEPDPTPPAAPVPSPIVDATNKTAAVSKAAVAPVASVGAATPAEWPGFRGPRRDGVIRGVLIDTDWTTHPPALLWRQPIGPGWSSFSVQGNRIYTQEQRGEDELISCYDKTTGKAVWRHRDHVRFYESNGGPGPRGTPTLANGRVYALGATGILNVLDAGTGAVIWSRNAAGDTKTNTPMWGFSSSPVVTGNLVIVSTSGKLVGYDAATGTPRWYGPVHTGSYSSPQPASIDGVDQIVMLSGDGATSVSATTGAVLWEHAWKAEGAPIVQPAVLDDGVLIDGISAMGGVGIRRLTISHAGTTWSAAERWTSAGLKPYFNDFVVNKGYAYGFDGSILSCIDLNDGARKWKGGRYGNGQLALLPDQDVLLVISEEGELALVSATPGEFKELARAPALDGKTWNHPVIAGDTLLVRNGEAMAAFKLTLQRR